MIKSVQDYLLAQLFNIETNVVYRVPRYQREYTWGKTQWENLFDDVLESDPGYFLGSIICINQADDVFAVQYLEVVDGQQRLTTLSLLFAAIYEVLESYQDSFDDEQRNELINLKRKLVLKKNQDEIRVIPQIQNNNQDDYRAVLAQIGLGSVGKVPAWAGNRKIFKAFRYFKQRIEELAAVPGTGLAETLGFLNTVNQACLVKIEVASHADAYKLFESLNNRGMPLTAVDLIKNKLLSRLESDKPGTVDHHFDEWNRLLGYLGDNYTVQERFFRQYYNAFKEDLSAIHRVPVATRSNLMHIFEKLINHDAEDCLERISAAGQLYAVLLSRNTDYARNALEVPLKDLDRIQGAPSYVLMLFLLVRKEQLRLDDEHVTEIVELLMRFFVRRNLTDMPPTRDLTRLFMSLIDSASRTTGSGIVKVIRDQLIAISASDDAFRLSLEGPIYEENLGVTRFILYSLAERAMTKETWIDLWRYENKRLVWTVEHVFPQGENIPQSWVTMIAAGDVQKAEEYQQTHVHKLGNLTISGFNSTLGNKSFAEKRDRTDRAGRWVGYKNGLRLNEDLASAEAWGIEQIDIRTKKLVDQAMALFRMNEVDA